MVTDETGDVEIDFRDGKDGKKGRQKEEGMPENLIKGGTVLFLRLDQALMVVRA